MKLMKRTVSCDQICDVGKEIHKKIHIRNDKSIKIYDLER